MNNLFTGLPARYGKRALITGVVFAALAGTACSRESLADAEPVRDVTSVSLQDNSFEPRAIEVSPGTEVTWAWDDAGRLHDVSGEGFTSEAQTEGSFRHRFEAPGTYDYECTLHPGMTGRVIVKTGP